MKDFNSQICTRAEQSERLLALGVKPETADCTLAVGEMGKYVPIAGVAFPRRSPEVLPAWSLHRLIEIVAHTQYPYYVISKELPIYDALCQRIEWLIKEGYFNKEYLEEQAESSREGMR